MKTTRKSKDSWPRKITLGRESVTLYRRKMPNGSVGFMVANYAERDPNGKRKRRFDSYATETEAVEAAQRLARQMSQLDVIGASMTRAQSIECASVIQTLEPLGIALTTAVSTFAEAVKLVGDPANVIAAAKYYKARLKIVTPKRVADVVAELVATKEARGASPRYVQDLRNRLDRFAADFSKDIGNVTTADIQAWLDGQKFRPQNYMGFRRVIHLLLKFAVARGYAADNLAENVERVKVNGGDTKLFTPKEIAQLLAVASPEFVPCLAIGAFAGLRSAEIERLEWSDIDLAGGHIIVGATKSKTASRRVVPIADNLAAWLAPYAGCTGPVWSGGHDEFYEEQQTTAKAAELKWKSNALRHSYASYRFALTGDAGRVAGECGNSASVIHKHYRELCKPADATRWFNVKPEAPANIVTMDAASNS